jgi:hypothetical protein
MGLVVKQASENEKRRGREINEFSTFNLGCRDLHLLLHLVTRESLALTTAAVCKIVFSPSQVAEEEK